MATNDYTLALTASLQKTASKKQINADIKQLEKALSLLRVTGTFAKGETKRELNDSLRTLQSQLDHIKLNAKLDNRKVQREINDSLSRLTFHDIDLLDIDQSKLNLKLRKVLANAGTFLKRNPLSLPLEVQRKRLNQHMDAYLERNGKAQTSPLLQKEAGQVRQKIETADDSRALKEAAESLKLYQSSLQAAGLASQDTADNLKLLLSQARQIPRMFGASALAISKVRESLHTIKINKDILKDIQQISDFTQEQLRQLEASAYQIAGTYGQTSSGYLTAVQQMARSGYGTDSAKLGELSLMAQSAGPLSEEEANRYLMAADAAGQYSANVEKLNAALDGTIHLAAQSSVSLSDLTTAVSLAADAAADAGLDIAELTAAEAAMLSLSSRSGGEVGQVFQSALSSLEQTNVAELCTSLGLSMDLCQQMLSEYSNGVGSALAQIQSSVSSLERVISTLQNQWDGFLASLSSQESSPGVLSFFEELLTAVESLSESKISFSSLVADSAATAPFFNKEYGINQIWNPDTRKLDVQGNLFGLDFTSFKQQKKHFQEAEKAIEGWNEKLAGSETDININTYNNDFVKKTDNLKDYLSSRTKENQGSLEGYKSYLNSIGESTDALRLKTVLMSSAMTFGLTFGVQAAATALSSLAQVSEDVARKAENIGTSFSGTSTDLSGYQSKAQELHAIINDSSSSYAEVAEARRSLLALQDEMLQKYGTEQESINTIIGAVRGEAGAFDALTESKWNAAKAEFNQEDLANTVSNFFHGYDDNLNRMEHEYGEYNAKINLSSLNLSEKEMDSLQKQLREYLGDDTLNIDLGSQGAASVVPLLELSGNATEVYDKLLQLKGFFSEDSGFSTRAFQRQLSNAATAAQEVSDKYQEAYDNYILNEKIFKDTGYNQAFQDVNAAYENYQSAINSDDETARKKAIEEYDAAIASASGSEDVQKFLKNMRKDMDYTSREYKLKDVISDQGMDSFKGKTEDQFMQMYQSGELSEDNDDYAQLLQSAREYHIITEENAHNVQKLADLLAECGVLQESIAASGNDDSLSYGEKFQNLWESSTFANAREQLTNLAKESAITGDSVRALAQENASLSGFLTESGMSAEFAASCFTKICEGADGFSIITEDALALDEVLNGMNNRLQEVAASKSEYDSAMGERDYNAEFLDYQEAYKNITEMMEKGEYGRHFYSTAEFLLGDAAKTMDIEEIQSSLEGQKDIFGADADNGTEFLDRLYQQKELLEEMNSSLERNADGSYEAHLDPKEFAELGKAAGLTTEQVTACVNALGMFGTPNSYNLEDLTDTVKNMSVAFEDGSQSFLSLQGLEETLSNLGQSEEQIRAIIQNLQNSGEVQLINFRADDKESLASTVNLLKELDMIEIDGSNINVESLSANLRESFQMTTEDITAFLASLSNNYQLTDNEGASLSLEEASAKIEAKASGVSATAQEAGTNVDGLKGKIQDASQDVTDLDNKTLSNISGQFQGLGISLSSVAGKLRTILSYTSQLEQNSGSENAAAVSAISGPGNKTSSSSTGGNKGMPKGQAAFAAGSLGIPRDETALINELGEETIVDPQKGTYEVVQGGPQLRRLKKGQIVLNHLQTRAFLKRGPKSSGSTYASGPAHASGSSTQTFDFIETALSRFKDALDRLTSRASDTFRNFNFRIKEYSKAYQKSAKEEKTLTRAKDAYLSKANSVGLEESWARQVRDGSINLADVEDEELKKRIQDYQKWYEKALKCQEQLEELKKTQKELLQEKIELLVTRYENAFAKLESAKERIQNKMNLKELWGFSASKNDYQKLNNNIRDQLFSIVQQIQKLKELQKTVEKNSQAWQEYQERIDSGRQSIQDLTTSIGENAIASAALAKENADKKNDQKDIEDERLDSKISTASTASRKNSQIEGKVKNINDRQNNAQTAYQDASKAKTNYGQKIKKASQKHVSKKYKSLFDAAIKNVKAGKLVPESVISQIADALEVTTGKEYHELRKLLTYCNYYNANKNAEEENEQNLRLQSLAAQESKKKLREEQLGNLLDENQQKAERSAISSPETAAAQKHNLDAELRQSKSDVKSYTKARKNTTKDRKDAAKKAKFYDTKPYKNLKDKKLKKQLKKAVSAIKSGKKLDQDSLEAIKKYCQKYLGDDLTYYYNCLAYNEAVENELSAKEAETMAKAESYAKSLQVKREKTENTVSERERKNDLYGASAKNQTSAKGKNRYVDRQITNIAKNQNTYQKAWQNSVKDFNAAKGKVDKSSSKDKSKQKIIKNIKSKFTSKSILIPPDWLEKAYSVSDAFGLACENYNEALNHMQAAKEAKDLNDQTSQSEIAALALEKMSNIEKEYSNKQQSHSRKAEAINHAMDLAQAKGYQVGTKSYEQLIQNETGNYALLRKKKQEMAKALETSVKNGNVKRYSDEWYEMTAEIDGVTEALETSSLALAQYQQQLQQISWDNFDYLQERIGNVTSEMNFLLGELAREDLADEETGGLTDRGKAAAYLHAASYETYRSQAKSYQKELDEINKSLANDPYRRDLIERRDELRKSYQDSIQGAQEEKYAVIDLYKQGYEALSQKLQNVISDYGELLDAEKDAYDYQNTIADKTKEIANIRKQLTAYAGDGSEETKAKLQSLTVSLEQAEKDLQETQYNKYISDTKDMLSDLQENFQESIQELIDALSGNFQELMADIAANAGTSVQTLTNAMTGIGYTPSESFTDLLNKSSLSTGLGSLNTAVQSMVTNIEKLCTDMEKHANKTAEDANVKTAAEEPAKQPTQPAKQPTQPSSTPQKKKTVKEEPQRSVSESRPLQNSTVPFEEKESLQVVTKKIDKDGLKNMVLSYLKSHLKSTKAKRSSLSDLNKKLYDNFGKKVLSEAQMKELSKILSVKYDNQKSSGKLYKKLKSIGIKGFQTGSAYITKDQLAFLGEDGYEIQFDKSKGTLREVGVGDRIFTADMTKNLWAMAQVHPNDLLKSLHISPVIPVSSPAFQPGKSADVTIDMGGISMYEVNDPETFAKNLTDAMNNNTTVRKTLLNNTVETLSGSYNSLSGRKFS